MIKEVEFFPESILAMIPQTDGLINYVNDNRIIEKRFLATFEDEPVGFLTFERLAQHRGRAVALKNPNASVMQIIVDPKWRSLGIGKLLIQTIREHYPEKVLLGHTSLNPSIGALAKKYGIRQLDSVYSA
jgi:GNAT superfamily N-acetyltransferase